MVVKTETCCYTEYKIYPGHGQKFIAKDGKTYLFLTHKCEQLFHQKIKAQKLRWTQAWRRMNKKGKAEDTGRVRRKKAAKVTKAIAGMSLEDINRKRAKRVEINAAAKEAAIKEAKLRSAKKDQKKTGGAKLAAQGAKQAQKAVKNIGGAKQGKTAQGRGK